MLLVVAAGCRGPRVVIRPNPVDSAVFVDGAFVPTDATLEALSHPAGVRTIPYRYYGQLQVTALPAGERLLEVDAAPPRPARQLVELSPPAPRWIFPFDFVVEMVTLPFAGMGDVEVDLQLAEEPEPILPGQVPAGFDELRERARASRGDRSGGPTPGGPR